MIRMYFDADATQVIRDSVNPTEGQPDYYEGPGEGGEVTAVRYLFNPTHATDRFEDVSLTAYQDDDQWTSSMPWMTVMEILCSGWIRSSCLMETTLPRSVCM